MIHLKAGPQPACMIVAVISVLRLVAFAAAGLLTVLLFQADAPLFPSPVPPTPATSMEVSSGRYTQHVSRPARRDSIAVSIAADFAARERAQIVEALGEWNLVLNGYIRFSLLERDGGDTGLPALRPLLQIERLPNAPANLPAGMVAVSLPTPEGTGLILVFGDRLEGVRLDRILLHEIGHVLGLTHRTRGRLMRPQYNDTDQNCVDRETVAELAELRRMPFAELNWCTPRGQ